MMAEFLRPATHSRNPDQQPRSGASRGEKLGQDLGRAHGPTPLVSFKHLAVYTVPEFKHGGYCTD